MGSGDDNNGARREEKPSIVFSGVWKEDGEVVEVGQKPTKEVREAVVQAVNFRVNTHRVFRPAVLLSGNGLVVVVKNEHAFVAMHHPGIPMRVVMAYLAEIVQAFELKPTKKELKRLMENRMNFYSYDPSSDKIRAISEDVQTTKDTLHDCLELLLERQEKTELIEGKTELLKAKAEKMAAVSIAFFPYLLSFLY